MKLGILRCHSTFPPFFAVPRVEMEQDGVEDGASGSNGEKVTDVEAGDTVLQQADLVDALPADAPSPSLGTAGDDDALVPIDEQDGDKGVLSDALSKISISNTEGSQDLNGQSFEVASEAPASPSSVEGETSGYLGGSGSTSASTSGTDEIVDKTDPEKKTDGSPSFRTDWVPGKRHADEDDSTESWRQHKKHFFILSNAGKPVYSRYGDEHKLAGFSATLQAIMSFVENGGDRLHLVRAGNHQFIFLVRGPLYLVSISATEEPFLALKRQLELLHGQLILILTKAVERCFAKNANFDMKPLLGGTDVVFSALIHSFNWNPTTFLHAYACLPLPYAARQTAGAALQDVAESGVLFALLMSGHKVINMVGPRKASLHPDDLFLLSNFVASSDSFRTTETFSPVCLPHYNANAFLYAYVQYLNENVYLILLSTASDSFYHLKDCRTRVEMILRKSRVLHEASRSVACGGLLVKDVPSDSQDGFSGKSSTEKGIKIPFGDGDRDKALLGGPSGLWHFAYRSSYLEQYVASEYTPPLNAYEEQKRLFRAYQRIHFSMHDENGGYHKMQYRRDENYVLMYWRTSDFELYAAFDPLAEKSTAIRVSNQICQWIRNLESEIFLLGATPFNW